MKMELGDLLFVKGNCYVSPFIRFFLKSPYTHVTIAVDHEKICEVDLHRKMEIIQNPYEEYKLYRLKKRLTDNQQKKLLLFLHKKVATSKGYDWWRLLSLCMKKYFRWNIIIHEQDKYICSEIIDKAFQHIGIDLVEDLVTGDVTPIDIMQSKKIMYISTINKSMKSLVGGEIK
ncbi:hypothetical protein [Sutcliffiella rhizosphaerae]|uniref:Permuted papain-like amidase enzyme, YaeF/YiiX, C92 family n=1 Tax=Sutcliffiella rhizosphaerae TaxID=2880967 RepID=A0ABM8YQU6_9BACI|nr:hypothetical protein [Sutcliffiella rhizosphaerae]CAG9622383.1 hypothetical protein BACCIP111883_03174 [Sutcliffiella rhizosphaerae]